MSVPNANRALSPIWFRFTDPEDQGKYGDQWFTYDEGAHLRMRARDLITLETDLGMPVVAVMNGFRDSTVLGDTAVAWLGVRAADPSRAGEFDQFNPITMLIEWSKVEPEPVPKEDAPEATPVPPASPSMTDGGYPSMTSAPMDTVALPSLPPEG